MRLVLALLISATVVPPAIAIAKGAHRASSYASCKDITLSTAFKFLPRDSHGRIKCSSSVSSAFPHRIPIPQQVALQALALATSWITSRRSHVVAQITRKQDLCVFYVGFSSR